MCEFHEIGTPTDWELVAASDGRVFRHSAGDSQWTSRSVFAAALDGDVEFLITHLHTPFPTVAGTSCMHYAVAGNQVRVVAFLLTKLPRPHAPDKAGVTPFSLACRYGHLAIVQRLLEGGALLTSVDRRGNTGFHEAALLGQNHVLEFLLPLVTCPKFHVLLGHLVWAKNSAGKSCFDLAEKDSDTALLILGYMRGTAGFGGSHVGSPRPLMRAASGREFKH